MLRGGGEGQGEKATGLQFKPSALSPANCRASTATVYRRQHITLTNMRAGDGGGGGRCHGNLFPHPGPIGPIRRMHAESRGGRPAIPPVSGGVEPDSVCILDFGLGTTSHTQCHTVTHNSLRELRRDNDCHVSSHESRVTTRGTLIDQRRRPWVGLRGIPKEG
jgi:hypothetical protein